MSGTTELKGHGVTLRPFVEDDARYMYLNWACDDEVTKYLTWPTHKSPLDTQNVVNMWVDSYKNDDNYQWAIVPDSVGQPIGSISVVHIDKAVNRAEVGYCIGRKWWHQGITSRALALVIDYLFKTGFDKVSARHDVRNPVSGLVMKKCGMTYEGTLRRSEINNCGICDVAYYSILKEEYNI